MIVLSIKFRRRLERRIPPTFVRKSALLELYSNLESHYIVLDLKERPRELEYHIRSTIQKQPFSPRSFLFSPPILLRGAFARERDSKFLPSLELESGGEKRGATFPCTPLLLLQQELMTRPSGNSHEL